MKINVTENKVSIKEEQILNENEYNIHKIQFDFSSEYTDDLVKVALFSIDNHTYKKIISNNECDIPPEVLTQRGYSILGVYAYKTEQDTLVLRYSPSPTKISVYDGSYKADAENSEPITPSEIEQYQQILQNSLQQFQNQYNALVEETEGDIQAIEDELQRKVDEGYFDGEDGFSPIANVIQLSNGVKIEIEDKTGRTSASVFDGYSPQRGVDYFTQEDIEEIETDVKTDLQEIVLVDYSLITETGSKIELSINTTNYKLTAILKDKNNDTICTSNEIDLPLETMVVNATYDNTTKEIVLTLQNGTTVRFSVADLVSGLVSESQLQTVLANYYTQTEVNNLLKIVDISSNYLSNKINSLNSTIFNIGDFEQAEDVVKTENTKYINNNGVISTAERSSRTAVNFPIPLNTKEIIVQGLYVGTAEQYSIFFCDDNGNIIDSIYEAETQTIDGRRNCILIDSIPSGTTYIYYTHYTNADENVQLIKTYTNEIKTDTMPGIFKDYIMDFSDKSSDVEWITGYAVLRGKNSTLLTKSSSYAIANISVKKGDIIIINRRNGLSKDYASFARRFYDGKEITYRSLENIGDSTDDFVKDAMFCFSEDMNITLTTVNPSNTQVKWFNIEAYANSFERTARLFNRFPFDETMKKIIPLYMKPRNITTLYQRPLVLLHASDVHNVVQSIVNIRDFTDIYGKYIDDVLITGDLCSEFPEYSPIYAQEGFKKMLLTIGNHDVYNVDGEAPTQGDVNHWASNTQKYYQYFKPSIDEWNVTQPENAETNGYCYYYKDYNVASGVNHATVSTVRLICLDAMAYDETQHNWLQAVLNDALTNNITVLIANHFPPTASANNDFNLFDTGFSSLIRGMEADYAHYRLGYTDGQQVNHNAPDLVDEFINAGGEFACWLCGHLHYGQVGTLISHPNQIFIAVEQCSIYGAWSDTPAEINNPTEDLFNIVAIDTYNKVIKVARIGAEYDMFMRHKSSMSIDYANRRLISSH